MKAYIGIDLGGKYIKYGLVSGDSQIAGKGKIPMPLGLYSRMIADRRENGID